MRGTDHWMNFFNPCFRMPVGPLSARKVRTRCHLFAPTIASNPTGSLPWEWMKIKSTPLWGLLLFLALPTGIEPVLPEWESDVLTARRWEHAFPIITSFFLFASIFCVGNNFLQNEKCVAQYQCYEHAYQKIFDRFYMRIYPTPPMARACTCRIAVSKFPGVYQICAR